MNELVEIIFDFLQAETSPELRDADNHELDEDENRELAQDIAEAIVAAGWKP